MGAWQRVNDEHLRWEIQVGERRYLVTDAAIRTFGRRHMESVILKDLPPLPSQAWEVEAA